MSETFQEMLERYKRELLGVQKHKVLPPGESEAPISPNPTYDGEEKTEYPCKQEKETDFSQTAGENGLVLLQDGILHETLENFVHTKIPERAVHVKGYGAFGTFQLYQSLREYTSACFLQESGSKTPVFVRFSQAAGKKGSPDTARDIRGFALKFYTQQGNYDIVGNHIPVFFVRDSMRFPETIAALSPSPHSNLPDPRRLWEFVAHTPQTIHMLTWLYSDWGTLASYRHMRGYGVNTFVWKNAHGKRRLIKYHWRPCAGVQYLTRQEAIRLAGREPDIAGNILHQALRAGKRVEYEMYVQIMDPLPVPYPYFQPS